MFSRLYVTEDAKILHGESWCLKTNFIIIELTQNYLTNLIFTYLLVLSSSTLVKIIINFMYNIKNYNLTK